MMCEALSQEILKILASLISGLFLDVYSLGQEVEETQGRASPEMKYLHLVSVLPLCHP